MDAIAARVKETGGSTIVLGDLNCTDGSVFFRDLLATTGLRDSRLGFGRQGSWPTDQFYRIAIDHVFVSTDIAVSDRRLGPLHRLRSLPRDRGPRSRVPGGEAILPSRTRWT